MRRPPALALLIAVALCLSGCGLTDTWLGGTEAPPLPGERVAVLAIDESLEPDPGISDLRVMLPQPYRNTDWDQAGGNAAHVNYHLSLVDDPRILWRADIGEGHDDDARILAQPLVVGGTVYTMDSRALVSAFDAAEGDRKWRIDLSPEDEEDGFFGGGIAYADGRLFVSTGFARAFALDASSGEVLWESQVDGPLRAAPTVSGDRVFVVTLDNQLEALAVEDGRSLWTHTGIQEIAGLVGAASPAVDGSNVIVPYSSGEIFALRAENGRVLWSDSLAAVRRTDQANDIAHVRGLPVIDRGMVLAISHSGRMAAIDLRRGLRAWEAEIGGIEMPWVGGDFIYVLSVGNQVVALTRAAGRIRWVQPLPRFEDPEDLEGPIRWLGPVLAGDRLIVASSESELWALSPYTGQILGRVELPDSAAVTPVVADETLYIVTEGGQLIAMR